MKKQINPKEIFLTAKNKIAKFATKNSVYGIFAAVLVVIVAITVFSLPWGKNPDNPEDPTPTSVVDAVPTITPNRTSRPTQTARPTTTPQPTTIPTPTTLPNPTEGPLPTFSPLFPTPTPEATPDIGTSGGNQTNFTISLPFDKKDVITDYSNTVPIYSSTLDEWRCHVGLDFKCNEGDSVNVAADGIIYEIVHDDVYGTTVYVQHADDFITMYRGLKDVNVNPDELVKSGQSIGTAANAIPYEAHMPTHVHFELIKDNLSVDPHSFAK